MTYEDVDLEKYDDQYTEAQEPDYEDIPDGKYQVLVDKAEITKAKTSGNPMLKWTLKILGPNNINRLLWTYHVLNNPTGQSWLKKDLNLCDVHLNKLSDLPKNLEYLLDIKLEVTVRTRDESQNVYFNRRLNDTEVHQAKDDDLPF
ncbi:MAG: DUF669 domain-containing protein [Candidatus Marinimicrobia bacterium]|nr:DUF669 domain-containing protein [Candidatus Neomarinimicrobiota bacterium]